MKINIEMKLQCRNGSEVSLRNGNEVLFRNGNETHIRNEIRNEKPNQK